MAVLALVLSLFWAVSYALSVHQRRQAERLLEQLYALQPGAKEIRTPHQIAREFGGGEHCADDLCNYDFDFGSFIYSSWLRALRRTEWDYLGLRPWWLIVRVQTMHTEITDIEFAAGVGRGRGWLYSEGLLSGDMWSTWAVFVIINADRFKQQASLEQESGYQVENASRGIIVRKPSLDTPGGGEALNVYLSPSALPDSRRVAFDVGLHCATAIVPCTEYCQLAPSPSRMYLEFLKSKGWSMGDPMDCTAR
jgi:hypothetical protein